MTIPHATHSRRATWIGLFLEALSVHEFSEVVCPMSIAGLERKVYFSRYGENVAQFVIFVPDRILGLGISSSKAIACRRQDNPTTG
jgi:hypothetical protein